VSCPLGAVHATPRRWHKLRVALIERREFQDEEDVRLNPEMQITDRQQNTDWFRGPVVNLFEASGEHLFLLVGRQFRQ
jgi:hypothetical protein